MSAGATDRPACHPEPGDPDVHGWEPAAVKPFWALTNDQRRNLRHDAFDHALETVQRRGGDPAVLRPGFLAAFDAGNWPAVEAWLRGSLPS